MPKQSSSNSNATSSSSSSASAPKSDYHWQYYKAYGGWHGFMQSYGLKPYDPDDVQEGKDIIAGFRNIDGAGADAGKAENK